jgi:CheY-like chemotaxis protein
MNLTHDCRIMHIDDNPRDIELMELAFKDVDAARVAYAGITDPVVGIRQLTEGTGAPPSIVMLDLNMPMMSGVEVLQRMRSLRELDAVRVVVFTTSKSAADRERCLALGATAVISKPASFSELIGVAQSIVDLC